MAYNVITFIGDKKIKSEEIKVTSKTIYGVLNKYIREKEYEVKQEKNDKKVMNF